MIKHQIESGFEKYINTLIPSVFKDCIEQKVFERKVRIYKSQNLNTIIKSEYDEIFKNSQSVSFI